MFVYQRIPKFFGMLVNKERAYDVMEKYGLDAVVAAYPPNVTYFSELGALSHDRMEGSFIFVVFPRDKNVEPALIISVVRIADLLARRPTWIKDIRTYDSHVLYFPSKGLSGWEVEAEARLRVKGERDPFIVLKKTLEEKGLHRGIIGIDERRFTFQDYERLAKTLNEAHLRPANDIMREIRMVKNEDQIAIINQANQITEEGIRAMLESVRVGWVAGDFVRTFSETTARLGALPFSQGISFGENSYLASPLSATKQLERGDIIRMDVTCLYKFHYTDIGRTAVVGRPTDRQRQCYDVVRKGVDSARQSIRPGVKASEVFRSGVEGARKAGMPNYERVHCGHGIALEMYEFPSIIPSSNTIIEEGSVINLETPYYEVRNGGYIVEDSVLVTKSGAELMSQLDRNFIEIQA
jgi:Xaa-Pro dipeptidase